MIEFGIGFFFFHWAALDAVFCIILSRCVGRGGGGGGACWT